MKTTKYSYKRTQRGFSLVDALITSIVLAIGMVSVAKFQGTVLRNNAEAKSQLEAVHLAQEKIEQIRSASAKQQLDSLQEVICPDNINNGADCIQTETPQQQVGRNTTYERITTIVPVNDPAYSLVTSIVNWEQVDGTAKTASLTSIVADANPVASGKLLLIPCYLENCDSDDGGNDDGGNDDGGNDDGGNDDGGNDDGGSDDSDNLAYNLIISGSFILYGTIINPSITVSAQGNYSVSCANSTSSYQCDVGPISPADGWTGSVSVSTDQTYCNQNPSNPLGYVGIVANQSQDYNVGQNENECP